MNEHWLDLLSNIDKMVLGSIVGSVVLAFLLLVIVFSVKIKSQHEKILSLEGDISDLAKQLKSAHGTIKDLEHIEKDRDSLLQTHQKERESLQDKIEKLQESLEKEKEKNEKLQAQTEKLKKEKSVIIEGAEKIQIKLEEAEVEAQEAHKRNEFWIDQLSELRNKHDALKQKLRNIENKQR